jgi:ABC-type antimicrobial peptide transport system permease subunit
VGAQRRHILAVALASAGLSVGTGLVAGLALCFVLRGFISRWTGNGVPGPLIVFGTCSLLLAVAALACLIPAWQALTVEPSRALRHD